MIHFYQIKSLAAAEKSFLWTVPGQNDAVDNKAGQDPGYSNGFKEQAEF